MLELLRFVGSISSLLLSTFCMFLFLLYCFDKKTGRKIIKKILSWFEKEENITLKNLEKIINKINRTNVKVKD